MCSRARLDRRSLLMLDLSAVLIRFSPLNDLSAAHEVTKPKPFITMWVRYQLTLNTILFAFDVRRLWVFHGELSFRFSGVAQTLVEKGGQLPPVPPPGYAAEQLHNNHSI